MYKNKEYWNEFYSENSTLKNASKFCESDYLVNLNSEEYIVVELGCGAGADSFKFANKGFEVIGIDGSSAAIAINKTLENDYIVFRCINLSDNEEVIQLFEDVARKAKKNNKKVLVYTRFFLHAISDEVETLLFKAMREHLNLEFCVVSEFRVKEDENLYKIYDNHYRRYIDTNNFMKERINEGFNILNFEKGRGISPYKDEDPFLCRIKMTYC